MKRKPKAQNIWFMPGMRGFYNSLFYFLLHVYHFADKCLIKLEHWYFKNPFYEEMPFSNAFLYKSFLLERDLKLKERKKITIIFYENCKLNFMFHARYKSNKLNLSQLMIGLNFSLYFLINFLHNISNYTFCCIKIHVFLHKNCFLLSLYLAYVILLVSNFFVFLS